MTRRVFPLLAVVPIGVIVGLLLRSDDLSSGSRLALIAALAVPIVLVGTPFALLRRRVALPPPHVGQASAAGWELVGVYSDFPVSELDPDSAELTVRRDPAMLLPTVLPTTPELRGRIARLDRQELQRLTARVQVVEVTDPSQFEGRLRETPNDVTLWPRRRRPWYRRVMRRTAKAVARLRSGRGDRPERVIDHPAV